MLTYKAKLMFDGQEVYDHWVKLLCTVRDAYNWASKIVFDEKIRLDVNACHARLYKQMRQEFPFLPAQMCIKAYKHIISSYKSAKSNKHAITKAFVLKRPCVQLDKHLYSGLTKESFKISTGNGIKRSVVRFATYPKFDELASRFKMADPKIQYQEQTGEFYVCVPFKNSSLEPDNDDTVGIDLGCRRLATTSDGNAYSDKKYLANRRKIRHNKRIFQAHRKKSHSARTKLSKLRRKELNVSRNAMFHLANRVLKDHQQSNIVMEDLSKIKQSTSKTNDGYKRSKHNNRLGQVPFYMFRQILTYKAQALGRSVETVSPYMTSRTDCRSGKTEGERRGCRFVCTDGTVLDADWNAAINIACRKRPVSFSFPLDGRLNLIRQVSSTHRPSDERSSGKPPRL